MYVNIDKEKQQQKQTKKILGVYSSPRGEKNDTYFNDRLTSELMCF